VYHRDVVHFLSLKGSMQLSETDDASVDS